MGNETKAGIGRPVLYQDKSDAYTHILRFDGERFICQFPQDSSGETEAVARRFAACWNAMLGITDPAATMKEVVEVLGACRAQLEGYEHDATGEDYNFPRLNALLSKLSGGV